MLKNPAANARAILDWEDPLEKEMATLSSILAWKILWTEEFGRLYPSIQFSSVARSCPTLWPHGLQHARPPCLSPTPGVCSNSCSLSWWCHPTISSSVVPFSSYLQSFPASEYFQMSQCFASDDQNIGVSASTPVLPMNTQDWSPLAWTGWISLQSKGLSRVFSNTINNMDNLADRWNFIAKEYGVLFILRHIFRPSESIWPEFWKSTF